MMEKDSKKMSTNKEIMIAFNKAFDQGKIEELGTYITEDFEWHMLGESVIKGKAAMLQFFADHPDMKVITVTKDHVLAEGDTAFVSGEVQCTDRSGQIYDMYYCDVYELADGLIKKMISYTVNKKKVP